MDDDVARAADAANAGGGCGRGEDLSYGSARDPDICGVTMAVLGPARLRSMTGGHHRFLPGLRGDMRQNSLQLGGKAGGANAYPLHGIGCGIVVLEDVAPALLIAAGLRDPR